MIKEKRDRYYRLDAYLGASPLAVIQYDLEGNIELWNGSAEVIFGWTEKEVVGKKPPFVSEDKRKEFAQHFNRVIDGESFSGHVAERIRKDGTSIRIRIAAVPLRDKKDNITGVLTYIGDVTQLTKDLELLKESEEKYRTLAETARDFIIIHDIEGYIHYANPVATHFMGISESDFYRKNITEFIPAEQIENLKKRQKRRLNGDKDLFLYQIEIKGMNGNKIPVEVNSSPIIAGNKITQILIVARDITERLENERKLQQYNQRLTMLRSIDQGIILNHTSRDIAGHTLKKIRQLIRCDWVSILLFKENDVKAKIFAIEGEESPLFNHKELPISRNVRVRELKKGKVLIANDLENLKSPIFSFANKLVNEGVRSSMSAPLFANEELVGMLSLLSRDKDFFTDEHEEITREVSMHLAVTIKEVNMAQQQEESYKELEKRVEERTAELKSKNEQLERMNKLFVGREFRIKELKEQVKALERQLNKSRGN